MTKITLSLLLLFSLGHSLSAQESVDFPAQAEWLEKWENSRAYTLEALAIVPDSSLAFRPTEGQMSVQEQIQHISGNMFGLSRRFLDYEPSDFNEKALSELLKAETLDREALISLLNSAYDYGAAAVSNLPAERWEEEVPNFFAGPKSRRVIVYLLQDHATHHRAQVLIYLRLLELDPPRYRGW
ncbi:DinB family protein [Neolewinella persica]|uniref:DinB family protein n=1 Tax=Neolewinella persica TaxID=70998 RepID=UPI00035DEDA1|nr:DinB family protein [Neolewinella persica]